MHRPTDGRKAGRFGPRAYGTASDANLQQYYAPSTCLREISRRLRNEQNAQTEGCSRRHSCNESVVSPSTAGNYAVSPKIIAKNDPGRGSGEDSTDHPKPACKGPGHIRTSIGGESAEACRLSRRATRQTPTVRSEDGTTAGGVSSAQ